MSEIKRLNYFNGQFLVEDDFIDEQTYHLDMRRRLNRSLHTWGAVDGELIVTQSGSKLVEISKGMAIDKEGREIMLLEPKSLNIPTYEPTSPDFVYVTIKYEETQDETDHYTGGGLDNYTRTTERPYLEVSENKPSDGLVILLGTVHLDADGNIGPSDYVYDDGVVGPINCSARETISSTIASINVTTDQLADSSVTTEKIADNAVTDTKLASNSVTSEKIENGSVGILKIANNAIITTKLAPNSVASEKIQNEAITTDKLAANSVISTKIFDGGVETANLADNAVTTAKIKDLHVTTNKIDNYAVNFTKIGERAVINSKIAPKAVSLSKLDLSLYQGETTISANGTRGMIVAATSLDQPKIATLLIYTYSTTPGSVFEWSEQSATLSASSSTPSQIQQRVFFHNLSNVTIAITYKIYMFYDS